MEEIDQALLPESGIAIVGMAGQFPGAPDVETFWQNLCGGVESIRTFADEELVAAGIDPELLQKPQYVKAGGVLDDVSGFDAPFFGISARDAAILDPQQRFFLECAWAALEDAGTNPDTYPGPIGLYAGATLSSYMLNNLYASRAVLEEIGAYTIMLANDKDFLTLRTSYKLNLRGPSVVVQTACSTSLVAVHLACQSLLSGECDLALAGGVSIRVPQIEGYFYQEGDIAAPDGHCRAFDAQAQGTVTGNGVGVVVLKRLADALADGDRIVAVVRGSAVNNDGSSKIGFPAPSAPGQAAAIAEAQAVAGITPDTITYVEAHGTGTILGDPIEIRGLTQAFRKGTDKVGYCAIGSVKTNIGHLDTVAGVAGLIKTALALQHKQLPPSLHFTAPNPQIDFAHSPFFVNTILREWPAGETPRRAGVSAFGIGGTNAHAILEEAPVAAPGSTSRPWQLLMLSALSPAVLDRATERLAAHLAAHRDINLADVAYTLQTGRRAFPQRRVVLADSAAAAAVALTSRDPRQVLTADQPAGTPAVAFLFPGQGAQYLNMAHELYAQESVFREQVDLCAEVLAPLLGQDLRRVIYPAADGRDQAKTLLYETWMTQPALFVVEYALARLWMSWGVQPQAMLGHSIGEYVAACLAGVFSLEDALALVVARGRMIQDTPPGAMLAVFLPEAEARALIGPALSIAALNGPALSVIAGPIPPIDTLQAQLTEQQIDSLRLHTSHAFHAATTDPILEPFTARVAQVTLNPPQIPYISNVTGTWITPEEATDPSYWARHLRQTVCFQQGLATLLEDPQRALLEVGPGHTLSGLGRQHPARQAGQVAVPSLPKPQEQASDVRSTLQALATLWMAGVPIAWEAFYAQEGRRRVALPTYPFEHKRYWIDAPQAATGPDQAAPAHRPAEAAASGALAPGGAPPTPATNGAGPALAAPAGDVMARVAGIMGSLLGMNPGPDDSFFDLGGESLLAIQLVGRLRDAFQIDLALQRFFVQPTLANLTALVEEGLAQQQQQSDDLARLLAEIEGLSPEEVAAQLGAEHAESAPPITLPLPRSSVVEVLADPRPPAGPMDFSVFFFSSAENAYPGEKYKLVIEGARFADQHDFCAVWTPERHLHRFGGLYPNPTVLNAALAMVTSRVRLRTGSLVAPLHHPLRIAEDLAIVDNLSGGRVDVAIATGFGPNDFVHAPDNFQDRRDITIQHMDVVRRLWRGEVVSMRGGTGTMVDVTLFPKPVQAELPIWVTASEHPDTFRRAGEAGANVLTALLTLTPDQLGERIQHYRAGRRAGGWDPNTGQVTVMAHTYVGASEDEAAVKEEVRQPFYTYLRSHFELIRAQAKSEGIDVENMSEADQAAVFTHAFDRYFHGCSLLGTPSACRSMIERLQAAGVTEIACLVDFGLSFDAVFAGLTNLCRLRDVMAPARRPAGAMTGNGFGR